MKKLGFLFCVVSVFCNNYGMNTQPQACDALCPLASLGYRQSYEICSDNCYIYQDEKSEDLACFCETVSCNRSEAVCYLCCCCDRCPVSKTNDCGTCCGAQFLPLPCLATVECIASVTKILCSPCFGMCTKKQDASVAKAQNSNA